MFYRILALSLLLVVCDVSQSSGGWLFGHRRFAHLLPSPTIRSHLQPARCP